MVPTSKIEIYQYTADDVENVRKYFNVDEQTIKQNVEILKNWLKQQQHLPQVADDDFLERMLLKNKFRIEETKQKLDGYYTLRGLCFQNLFKDLDILVPSKEIKKILVLPKLTKSSERIFYCQKAVDGTADPIRFIYYLSHICGLSLYNDYSIGDKWIFDYSHCTIDDFKHWTASRFSQFFKLYQKAYSGRSISFDIINPLPFTSAILSVIKLAAPEKTFSKIKVHTDLSSLYKSVPKELLPTDLGGAQPSIEELTKKMDQVFAKQQDFFDAISKNVSNEKLRIGKLPDSDLFGSDGSFKKLNID